MLSLYERRARLTPGLLGIAPVSVAIVALGLKEAPVIAALTGILTAAGGAYALSVLIGHLGRRAEGTLWPSWGGPPTAQMLRTRGTATNATQRDLWRTAVTRYTGVTLLTEAEEADDELRADDTINAAVGQCRPLGFGGPQGKPAVQAENAQYGFERNTYAFRWPARLLAALTIIALVVAPATNWHVSMPSIVVGVVVNAGFLIYWLTVPSEKRTRQAADRYANQLLHAVATEARSA